MFKTIKQFFSKGNNEEDFNIISVDGDNNGDREILKEFEIGHIVSISNDDLPNDFIFGLIINIVADQYGIICFREIDNKLFAYDCNAFNKTELSFYLNDINVDYIKYISNCHMRFMMFSPFLSYDDFFESSKAKILDGIIRPDPEIWTISIGYKNQTSGLHHLYTKLSYREGKILYDEIINSIKESKPFEQVLIGKGHFYLDTSGIESVYLKK